MFIKQESHVSHMIDVKLIFDDEVKDVAVKEGMYATFQYIRNGETRTVSGLVTRIGYEDSKPYRDGNDKNYYHHHNHYDPYNGHDCNPLFFESETIRPVPSTNPNMPGGPYALNNHSVYEARLDGRKYFIEVDPVANAYTGYQGTVRIFVPSIVNINLIYDECEAIVSPKGMDQIPFIRLCNGLLQYSTNGLQWYNIDGSNADEQRNAVNKAIVDIADNRAYILELKEEINTLKAIIESLGISIPDPTPSEPSDPSGGDNTTDPVDPGTEEPSTGDDSGTDTEDPGTAEGDTSNTENPTENPSESTDTKTPAEGESTGV